MGKTIHKLVVCFNHMNWGRFTGTQIPSLNSLRMWRLIFVGGFAPQNLHPMVAWGWKITWRKPGVTVFFLHGLPWHIRHIPVIKGFLAMHLLTTYWGTLESLEGTQVPIPIRPRTRRSEYVWIWLASRNGYNGWLNNKHVTTTDYNPFFKGTYPNIE